MYSTIATFWYCPSEVPELEFRAAIQGHYQILEEGQTELRRSLAASRHYFDYEIADKVIAAHKGQRKGVKLKRPGVEVISAFKPPAEVKPQEDIVMSRIGITEDDKQRVLAIQEEMSIGTQQDTMQAILNAADAAIALSGVLECQPTEVAERVEELREALEQGRRQNRELQAKLAEAEQMVGVAGGSTGTNKVIEQSLAMAHEFNTHLKGENERVRQQLGAANAKVETLRSQLTRFEASQQQLTQLQQLLNGGLGGVVGQAQPVAQAQAVARPVAQQRSVQPVAATQAQPTVQEKQHSEEESHTDKTEREIANLIREIMQYNDQQATDDNERWLVNQSTLKQLSTRSQTIIKRVLEGEMAEELQAHHDKYGLYGRRANVGKDIETLKAALGIQR